MDSVLNSVKKRCGLTPDPTAFDEEIIEDINDEFVTLNQLGVGPEKVASISSEMETWTDIFGDLDILEAVKTYVGLRVRLTFDPPASSSVLNAMERKAEELEWRLTNHTT